VKHYIKSAIATNPDHYDKSIRGTAYKVFTIENGELFPPKVLNLGKVPTPVGVWLEAEVGEFVEVRGVKRIIERGSKRETIQKKIDMLDTLSPSKQRELIKQINRATLAYRPGWHLGDSPRASQFDKKIGWDFVEPTNSTYISGHVRMYSTFRNNYVKAVNDGNVYYIEDIKAYAQVIEAPYFPFNFIWAKCEYVMNINYQDEADEQGYMRQDEYGRSYRSDAYQHNLAGLKHLPKDGYYRYRTNPDPDTVPWVISGAIKVLDLLDDYEVNDILLQDGISPIQRQGGNLTLDEIERLTTTK